MTRVVRLANFYSPESGGLRTTLINLGREYAQAGVEPFLIVPGAHTGVMTDESGVQVTLAGHRLPASGGYRVITSRWDVAEILDAIKPDRVEVSDKLTLGWVGSWAADRGIPAMLVSHERIDAILAIRFPSWFPLARAADAWNRRLVGPFDTVVCASAFAAEEYRRIGVENVTEVPLGVDLGTFSPRPRSSDHTTVELVCAGRLSKEKRPELAIGVLRQLRAGGVDAHLSMAGAGPLHASLLAEADDLPVTFLGHVHDRAELATIYARADVALAPCPVETFGLGILEALASGTPVVTADGGAGRELIDWSCGRAAALDARSMAQAVEAVLELPAAGRRAAARRRAERYPWSKTAARILAAHGLGSATVEVAG